ncbi:MAG: amidohydrolase [Albidovulum sp.]
MLYADLVLFNADIRTMDPHTPRASALAVAQGRVLSIGSSEQMATFAGPRTRTVDAGGRLTLPGFHDTHLHLQDGGQQMNTSVDLSEARSPAELCAVLASFAGSHQRSWVEGGLWYSVLFNDDNLNRQCLDNAVRDRPCFVMSSDAHSACINSKACEVVGLNADTVDPPNGHFVRDATGVPTGMLHEAAVTWVMERMPDVTDADYTDGVRYAMRHANAHGITSVLDASIAERHARVYAALAAAGELSLRVLATARIDPTEDVAGALERVISLRAAATDPMFRVHSAKFFLDGVFENRTAAMISDYTDGGNAPLMFSPTQIDEFFTAFDAARFQIHVHAIGDLAVRAALDGLETARRTNGSWPSHHHIAHIQSIDPADIPRFSALGVVANIQPLWARFEPSVTDVALPMVGPDRGRWMYAFRALRNAHAMLVCSSDWTVSTLNPFEIIETAITRKPPGSGAHKAVFLPEERLSLHECIAAYTINAAIAGWRQDDTGSLSVGKYADLIMLDRDIYACEPNEIGQTKVLMTLLAGQEVYHA